jgi:hypothetical protein
MLRSRTRKLAWKPASLCLMIACLFFVEDAKANDIGDCFNDCMNYVFNQFCIDMPDYGDCVSIGTGVCVNACFYQQ